MVSFLEVCCPSVVVQVGERVVGVVAVAVTDTRVTVWFIVAVDVACGSRRFKWLGVVVGGRVLRVVCGWVSGAPWYGVWSLPSGGSIGYGVGGFFMV